MVLTHACRKVVWLQILCSNVGFVQHVVRLDCESQSEIFLSNNLTYHSKMKHIDVQYNFMREMVENQRVLIEKVYTMKNVADSLTKSIST